MLIVYVTTSFAPGYMNMVPVLLALMGLLLPLPGLAESYVSLSEKYKVNDVICQNMSGSGWRNSCNERDIQGQMLVNMGAFLCGRRDWYPSKQAARKAGCYGL